ncbi:MAG: hypothetical protein IT581_10560 [Verrucomicrobiales bacterium]|nr:hypothetical protein [Verrucomicrobiales bacterium]
MNRQQLELAALAGVDHCLKVREYIAFDEVFREMRRLDAKHGQVPIGSG